jgi:peptidyl-prolyl cis-trans isomerase SurA
MMGPRPMGIILFIALTGALSLQPARGETLNRVVAIVNDDIITLHELNRKIKELTGMAAVDLKGRNEERYYETRRQVLELLIDDKITQSKIQEMGIKVDEKEIDEAIEKMKRDNKWTQEDLLSRLKEEGISFEKYKANMKTELERIQLINYEVRSRIIIREEMMKQYYDENKKKFNAELKVHLASIFLVRQDPDDETELLETKKRGEDILERLKAGENFQALARQYSQGPGAEDGGYLGAFKIDDLDPGLKKILEVIPEGGFSDLIIRPNGIQIIMVVRKEGGKVKSYEDVKEAIYGVLYQEEINKRYMAWIKELREHSYTKIIF